MSELSALKAIADAAPDGPWVGIVGVATTQVIASDGSYVIGADVSRLPTHRYVCTFDPPTVKALLAVVEAAEDLLDVFNGEADDLASCSYFRGEGACGFGCRDEPSCMTDIPEGGWPSSRLSAALAALHDTEGR